MHPLQNAGVVEQALAAAVAAGPPAGLEIQLPRAMRV